MSKTLISFFLVLCFLGIQSVKAQELLPLPKVLDTLQTRYSVSFSYFDSTIQNTSAPIPKASLTLEKALSFLNQNTQLHFLNLGNGQVVIQKGNQTALKKPFITQVLDEILITNYLTKGINLNKHGSITIDPENFGILPGLIEPDILQTIQSLPGINSVDETVSNLNIRGGTHDQNLILWDGIKMYQSGHFFGLISAFNPYLTDNVSVIKNGTSAQYTDGVSGTINMRLNDTITGQSEAGLGINSIYLDGYFKTPLSKKLELQLSARRSITDWIETPTYNQYFERIFQDTDVTNNQQAINQTITKNEAFYFYDVSGKLLYDLSKKDKLRLSFLTVNNNLDYLEQATINDDEKALRSGLTQSNFASGLEYKRYWSNRFTSTLHIYATKYELEATNYDLVNDQRLIQENDVLDTGLKLNTSYNFNKNINWHNGYQFFEVGVGNLQNVNNPTFNSYTKEVVRTHALYSEVDATSNTSKTHLRLGIRGNYYDKFNTFNFEPRLSFSQQVSRYFRVEVLGEFKSQATSQIIDLQNDFLGIEKRRWTLSNNQDRPLVKSKQASLGIHYKRNRLVMNAVAYFKKVDGITTRGQGFQNQYQFVNAIGNYQVFGADFLINRQFDKGSAWLSYSYSENDYTFNSLNDGNPFPNNLDITHNLTFAGTYTINRFNFALGVNWHSGRPTTLLQDSTPVNGTPNFGRPNQHQLEDYFRTDFSSTYSFDISKTSKGKVGLSIWNLFNQKYTLSRYYSVNNNSINTIEKTALGMTPNVSFRITF